jgi:hypothetical protein
VFLRNGSWATTRICCWISIVHLLGAGKATIRFRHFLRSHARSEFSISRLLVKHEFLSGRSGWLILAEDPVGKRVPFHRTVQSVPDDLLAIIGHPKKGNLCSAPGDRQGVDEGRVPIVEVSRQIEPVPAFSENCRSFLPIGAIACELQSSFSLSSSV